MDEQIRALADAHRRRILELVRDRELAAGEIAAYFEVTRPAISQHLTVLKQAGLVDERRAGTRRLYRTRPDGLLGLKEFVDRLWSTGLSRLKDAAEAEATDPEKD
ncbi:metalloregulator ArsR/SmtB family transcription factor [Kribbella sancticallisti]|uniref:Metalloregulator ArsR/SmtB family transcription factor n=1 Tax=Kribbella sancticallisti TaxID=460087 RepID=A0ABN2C6G9_9ACTN